ncbi:MAG: hypothetical protein DHS80DRAFT_29291 [Piptocephalis tieghemiana]|nr:MAG: hypothetical protein DHS80DRAFT_29291 [Piptocephalis tieghemiana]
MPPPPKSSSQAHKNLSYVAKKPAFLDALYAQVPKGHVLEDKFANELTGSATKGKGRVEEGPEEEETGEEAPQIVVLKEGKHLSADQVRQVRSSEEIKGSLVGSEGSESVLSNDGSKRKGEALDAQGRILFRPKASSSAGTKRPAKASSESSSFKKTTKKIRVTAKSSSLSFADHDEEQ